MAPVPRQLHYVLSLGLSLAVKAFPVHAPAPKTSHYEAGRSVLSRGANPAWGCKFAGNSDLYGLGIRVGVYLQLLSTLLAHAFLSDEIRDDARSTNAIIMVAVFAGMSNATLKGQMNAVEIFVMTTLLIAFLLSDFTPGHISNTIFFSGSKDTSRIISRQPFGRTFSLKEGTKKKVTRPEEKRYFGAISRSIFGTAIAMFNVWYWLRGRHTLLKNGIDDPTCIPTIYWETQLVLDGDQPMFYIIASVLFVMYEGFFMAWWVVILAPGTIRLVVEVLAITARSICCGRASQVGKIRAKVVRWHMEFARLDPRTLKMFERFKMTPKQEGYLGSLRIVCTWLGLPLGYGVIIVCVITIELTLSWNKVSGVYILGSTGQLIPFVVGLLGFLRNIHLIVNHISEGQEASKKAREIRVDWQSGAYVYGVGQDRELKLDAVRPTRRRSIDSGYHHLSKEGTVAGEGSHSGSSARSVHGSSIHGSTCTA